MSATSETVIPFDRTGTLIEVGDIVLYAHNLDRSAGLQWGKVVALDYGDDRYKFPRGVRVHVRGVSEYSSRPPTLLLRVGRLQYPDRVVVIPLPRVPVAIGDLLRGVT